MPLTASTFERVALEDRERAWELYNGRLREKPSMTYAHNDLGYELTLQLGTQLDGRIYRVRTNAGRVRYTADQYFIPDVMVIPVEYARNLRERSDVLEAYDQPLPLVIEIWSPSTGGYDVDTKFPIYRDRGDLEIWRLHPYDRTLTRWVRLADGGYREDVFTGGDVRPVALPDVVIDLDALFARIDG